MLQLFCVLNKKKTNSIQFNVFIEIIVRKCLTNTSFIIFVLFARKILKFLSGMTQREKKNFFIVIMKPTPMVKLNYILTTADIHRNIHVYGFTNKMKSDALVRYCLFCCSIAFISISNHFRFHTFQTVQFMLSQVSVFSTHSLLLLFNFLLPYLLDTTVSFIFMQFNFEDFVEIYI